MLIWCPVVNLTRIETPLILFQKVFSNMRADKAHPTVISTFPLLSPIIYTLVRIPSTCTSGRPIE
ncbi:hypothetical protein S100757_03613 [Bacillus subtilis subsp. subtilis]|nr:hypothetical protein S101444_03626 [Bacillus subtilis subsp. subtilis]ARW04515.1 hypothetical protein S100757_03613 [Bacillus subtilis subsp. subtilis]ASB58925.1 hypothetical protein S100761_03625 [Bacillus subtilis subsp. subtilis]